MDSFFPNAPDAVLKYITQVLYPPELEGPGDKLQDYDPNRTKSLTVTTYNNSHGRQTLFISEAVYKSIVLSVNTAFKGRSYAYSFSVPPAIHGQELYYVFYNHQTTDIHHRPINVTLARIVQDYWLNFARLGDPNGEDLPYFPQWGNNASVQGVSLADVAPTRDSTNNDRDRWWGLELYA
jgi:cholinesterase